MTSIYFCNVKYERLWGILEIEKLFFKKIYHINRFWIKKLKKKKEIEQVKAFLAFL